MRKGFAIGSIALALGCGVAGAQTTYSPAEKAAPTAQLPSAAAPVMVAPADHGATWGWGHDVDGGSGGHLDAGFELLVIRPYFDSNPALNVSITKTNPPTFTSTAVTAEQTNFDYPYTANPRVWLGYVTDSGAGFRVSWWQFEQSSNAAILALNQGLPVGTSAAVTTSTLGGLTSTLFIPETPAGATAPVGVPAAVAVASDIRLQVWDFEATGTYRSGCLSVEGSAGVRYAHLFQNFAEFASQANLIGTGSLETNVLLSGHNFNGAGPTLAAELRRSLGDSGLGLYASSRGAVLFGNKHATAILATETTPVAPAVATTFSSQFHSDSLSTIGVGEAEIGVEFSRKMGEGASLFVRAGIDGQIWIGAGNATSETGNLGFFGYTFTVGVNY
jgi:hypothetical protein